MEYNKLLLYASTFLLMLSATYILLNKRRRRRYKVRPLNRNRKQWGHYETLVKFIRNNDEEQCFKYLRMTAAMFDHLVEILKSRLTKDPTKNPLEPEQRLAMTLHYLSEGCSMQQIAWDYFVGKTTVHCVLVETMNIICEELTPIYLSEPSRDEWVNICNSFLLRWNMPNCAGAIDGKHISIECPKYSGTEFFNYKKSFCIVLMAACDAYYKFTLVDIGGVGSNHDNFIFRESNMGSAILNEELDIENENCLPGTNIKLPIFFVADQAFPLHQRIMRPYPGKNLNETKLIFNYRLSRARRCIENTFGIMASRWRILKKPIIANINTCEMITRTCVVLHNFVQKEEMNIPISERRYSPMGHGDYYDLNGDLRPGSWRDDGINLPSIGRSGPNNSSGTVRESRDKLADYFLTEEGVVNWQWDHVRRGSVPI